MLEKKIAIFIIFFSVFLLIIPKLPTYMSSVFKLDIIYATLIIMFIFPIMYYMLKGRWG